MNRELAQRIININKNTYELIAQDFSDTRNRIWPEMEMLVRKYVKLNNRILDLGCGNGRLLGILGDVEYLGVDASEYLIIEALKHFPPKADPSNTAGRQPLAESTKARVHFRVMDVLQLERLDERNFNIVFMFAVFSHLPSEELRLRALKDVKKLLKSGGLLIMTNWNMWQLGKKKNIWNYKITKSLKHLSTKALGLGFKDVITLWQSGDGKREGGLYYRAFTLRELNKLFKQAGFEVLENYYSDGKDKVHWWEGRNLVTVGRLI